MASKTTTIGSSAWVSAEKENALQLLQTEKEELVFPAQHQLEWLNEHVSEIFKGRQVDVVNVFKTPGKLKGKTPHTTRKRNVPDARIPLSDVFSSKPIPRPSPPKNPSHDRPHFEIATDPAQAAAGRSQTDSGYHGSSQENTELDTKRHTPPLVGEYDVEHLEGPDRLMEVQPEDASNAEHRTTEGSFHSAKEDQTVKMTAPVAAKPGDSLKDPGMQVDGSGLEMPHQQQQADTDHDFDELGSPSDESTPDRPLVRKSSLTFAALPAREPMKTSIGARVSRTSHVDTTRQIQPNASRPLAPSHRTQHGNPDHHINDVEMRDADDHDENFEVLGQDDSEEDTQTAKNYSKSSTQRLHEKIDMLGKAPAPRPSKSIPSASSLAAMRQHDAVVPEEEPTTDDRRPNDDDDDDDWIKPLTSPDAAGSSAAISRRNDHVYGSDEEEDEDDDDDDGEEEEFYMRAPELVAHEERMKTPVRASPGPGRIMPGYGHTKSASTATLASPAKAAMAPPVSPAKSISVSNPARATTTPLGSPKRYLDLSASKSKLQSIMKTAKGLFTTSASISAAAKLETLSPDALKVAANAMPGMYPNLNGLVEEKPLPPSPAKQGRRTRSSMEREKEERRKDKETQMKQRMDDQLEQAREQERRKVAEQKVQQQTLHPTRHEQPNCPSPKRHFDEHAFQEPGEPQPTGGRPARPIRPGREPPKTKPAPVSIRVGTLSQRMPNGSSQVPQDSLTAEPKRPGLTKKASTASLQSSTSTTLKSSIHGQPPKPRALLAAERKKEQDEREAQRKLEQKREIERKRAAQQEEARKQEQKQRAEAEKRERERVMAEQAKRQAQQQAIERKRQEAARKAEQQRLERAANEAAQSRPPSRLAGQNPTRSLINHPLPTNPAKPAKRPLEEEASRPQTSKYGPSGLTQGDSKRRKTEEEDAIEPMSRPVVSGAPIRQSQLGKKPSIFNHSAYTQAQPSGHLNQFPQPPSRAAPPQMQQYATGGRIPFADAAPPAPAKTPISMMQQKTIQTVKSSPQYPNGEAIHLPEIPTDSEDEDSEDEGNAFPIPDWATPGHLTEQLMRQEGMDGDAVFGPIAPLKMEEIFAKGNKDRLKRLRDRTSSANWTLSGDGLTLEEVRADREQRERMRLEGGWKFGR
ncbi:hypothetical protein PV08_00036 [Exophiala spinifera]|uniref:Inner centromere protein ARK-binding domain-containing protein n=1 Tax=Exophiala spinifera TaxID=91928 RepID=A0A0D2C7D5_9EURO|nr:uncharacterized protein PV08_00036 [Exophiala spinifera]KIW19464.1 hypothetical protein PV08_00036 [Exophiala spinifera]